MSLKNANLFLSSRTGHHWCCKDHGLSCEARTGAGKPCVALDVNRIIRNLNTLHPHAWNYLTMFYTHLASTDVVEVPCLWSCFRAHVEFPHPKSSFEHSTLTKRSITKRYHYITFGRFTISNTVDLEMSEIHTVVPPVYECKLIPNSYHYWWLKEMKTLSGRNEYYSIKEWLSANTVVLFSNS